MRPTKLTPKRRADFLAHLKATCNVTVSCNRVNVSRWGVYQWRKKYPDFKEEWDNALAEGAELLEAVAQQRAFTGVKRDVWYGGEKVGETTEYSDNLTMFFLKGLMPEKYRDNYSVTATAKRTGADGEDEQLEVTLEATRERILGRIDDYVERSRDSGPGEDGES